MKLVEIKYVDEIGAAPRSNSTYTYAAGNDVEVGQYRVAVARGKELKALVVNIHEPNTILDTLNSLPYPVASLQVIGEQLFPEVEEESPKESK